MAIITNFQPKKKVITNFQPKQETTQLPEEDKNIFIRGGEYFGEGIKQKAADYFIEKAKAGEDMSNADFGALLMANIVGEGAKLAGNIAGSVSKSIARVPRTLYNLPKYIKTGSTEGEKDINLPILGKVETYPKMMQQQAEGLKQTLGDWATPVAAGLTGLEAVGDITAMGELSQKGLRQLASRTLKPKEANVKELNTALRPGAMKAENLERWKDDLKTASGAITKQLKNNQALGKPDSIKRIDSMDDLYEVAKEAKSNIWNTVKAKVAQSGGKVAINGDDIAKALDDVMTPEMIRENPNALTRLDELQKAYRGQKIDVTEAESILETKNAALNSYYANRGNMASKYKTDWELRADETIARKLREGLDKAIDGFGDLKKEYGSLVSFVDKASRRVGVLKGQEGNLNLIQQYSWVEGLGKSVKHLANGDYADAAAELLRIPTANVIKYLNSSDFHASQAFKDMERTGTFDTIIRFLNKANNEGGDKAMEWLKGLRPGLNIKDVTGNEFGYKNPTKANPTVGEVGDLAQETGKYYHGAKNPDELISKGFDIGKAGENSGYKGVFGKGLYITNDLERAKLYGKPMDISIKDANLFKVDAKDVLEKIYNKETAYGDPDLINEMITKKGYDGLRIINKEKGMEEIVIMNKDIADKALGIKPTLSKSIDPLLQEARKYKSAEEFVKAQGEPVYHGTNANFTTFNPQIGKRANILYSDNVEAQGSFFTDNKDVAKRFADSRSGGTPRVIEAYVPTKKLLDISEFSEAPKFLDDILELGKDEGIYPRGMTDYWELLDNKKVVDTIKKQGYDSIKIREVDPKTGDEFYSIFSLNPSQIKTKSQLTDIWNKAQQIKKPILRK